MSRVIWWISEDLANQLDSLNEELESDYSGGCWAKKKTAKAEEAHSDGSLMKDKITINTDRTEYGDGRAEIFDLGLFDAKGNLTNLLLKGEMFTIKEDPLPCADQSVDLYLYDPR